MVLVEQDRLVHLLSHLEEQTIPTEVCQRIAMKETVAMATIEIVQMADHQWVVAKRIIITGQTPWLLHHLGTVEEQLKTVTVTITTVATIKIMAIAATVIN